MVRKLQAAAIMSCMLSYAMTNTYAVASTDAIGTASARGEMRVDSSLVNGNATLFNGSVVETGLAAATLHLGKGTQFTLAKSSRATFYGDHVVLDSGKGELISSGGYRVVALGLRVTAYETNSDAIVAVEPGNVVKVGAQAGSFLVANKFGVPLWETLSHRNLSTITRLFREAIDLNPRNAAAFAGLSQSLVAEVLCWPLSPSYAFATAQTALREALEIDHAMMPEVISAEGWIKLAVKRDWQGACCDFDIVLNRHPRFMSALMGRAMLHIANGSLKEASAHLSKIFRWNALNSIASALHCWCHYLTGDYLSAMMQIEQARASGQTGLILDTVEALASIQSEESHAQIERIESLAADSPGVDLLRGALGYAYAIAGKPERSVQILDAMTKTLALRKDPDPYAIALVLIGINRRREAVERLVQSYREGSLWSLGFRSDPILAQLETDEPHFRQLLSNFPQHIGEPNSQLDVAPRIHAGSHRSRI